MFVASQEEKAEVVAGQLVGVLQVMVCLPEEMAWQSPFQTESYYLTYVGH